MSRLAARASAGRWTRQSLRDVAYSGAVLAWSVAGFTILVSGAAVTGSLVVFVVGVLVWVGFAYVARWTTWVDRRLAGWQRHEHVRSAYVRPAAAWRWSSPRGWPRRTCRCRCGTGRSRTRGPSTASPILGRSRSTR